MQENNDKENLSDDEKKKIIKKNRRLHIIDMYMIRTFFAVLIICAFLAQFPALRPTVSSSEHRKLKEFPKLTVKTLFSGDFFDGINLWFSDTFPCRDSLMTFNGFITGTFGKSDVQIHGTVENGDEIPDINSSSPSSEPEKPPKNEQSSKAEENNTSSKPSAQKQEKHVSETLDAMLIVDNSAYEYYNFRRSCADSYAAKINKAVKNLKGKANVYCIIAPNSMAITAPESITKSVNSSDQKKAIDYMYSKMSKKVKKVDAYSALKAHRDEYIYFRTDHHWTARGAYYAYAQMMKEKGATAAKLSDFKEYKFKGFLGTFYSASGKKRRLGATPDTVVAYEPRQLDRIKTKISKSTVKDFHIVSNGNDLSAPDKYMTYICGDHPVGVMTNPKIKDKSTCIVIKESYGNAFVGFLTQNYRKVIVVDYRYIRTVDKRTLAGFVKDYSVGDVVFMNNISATRTEGLISELGRFIG